MHAPDHEAPEQDTLFVTIFDAPVRTGGNVAMAYARVRGVITVFAQAALGETCGQAGMRLPFGYFAKRIAQASRADTDPFFFESEQDIANSPVRMQNLHERQVNFTFLYSTQYDPDRGELSEININVEVQ